MKPITGYNDVVENCSTLLENNCPFQQSIIYYQSSLPTHEVKEISETDLGSLGSYK